MTCRLLHETRQGRSGLAKFGGLVRFNHAACMAKRDVYDIRDGLFIRLSQFRVHSFPKIRLRSGCNRAVTDEPTRGT